jgi:hypothetical protein
MNRNPLKQHLVEAPVTNDFTLHLRICDPLHDFGDELGWPFGHFLLGSHNATVTALRLCVKWSFECILESADTYSTGSSIQSRVEL